MKKGFTIVELLIVIVVIGILAAITIVAFNGVSDRAKVTSVKSDISSGVKKIEVIKAQDSTERFPSSLVAAGISASSGNTYYYQYVSSDNSYCLQSSNGAIQWYASSDTKTPTTGTCGSDSLVGQWLLNGNANDSTANSLNGTGVSTVSTTSQNGQANGAYAFNGTNSYVDLGNSTLFNQTELTMSAWARTTTTTPGSQTIMAKEGKYKYRFTSGSGVQVLAAETSGWSHVVPCAYSYAVNTWYHVAFTLSSSSKLIKIYVNGIQICEQPGPLITSYNTNNMFIGAYSSGALEAMNGTVDDARFYTRALSAAEMKGLYDTGAK